MNQERKRILFSFLKDVAKECNVPFTGYGTMTIKFSFADSCVNNGKVIAYEIKDSEATIKKLLDIRK